MAKIAKDHELFVSWMGNGHVDNGQSDNTCVRLMLADFAEDPSFADFKELPGGTCIPYWHFSADGNPETSTLVSLPAGARDGKHTLLWYWNFTDFWYSSCADIEILPSGAQSDETTPDQPAAVVEEPRGITDEQISSYLQTGCSAENVARPDADSFCVAYVGPNSYCKSYMTDACGRSQCHGGDFLLPCDAVEPEPEPEPVPDSAAPDPKPTPSVKASCGHDFCRAINPESYCKANGVCQWADVSCRC